MSMKEQWGRVYWNTAMLVPGVSGKSLYNRSKTHQKERQKSPLRERQCLANGRESTARQQRCWWLRPNTCIIDPHLHPPLHHHHVHQLGWKEAKQSTQFSQFKQSALLGTKKDLIPIIIFDWEKAGRQVGEQREVDKSSSDSDDSCSELSFNTLTESLLPRNTKQTNKCKTSKYDNKQM